jgi:hypothetical protein
MTPAICPTCQVGTYDEGAAAMHARIGELTRERDDARAAMRALIESAKDDARRCAQAGIDYNAVRGILRDYQEGEISVSRMMELIRTAALALAKEVQP